MIVFHCCSVCKSESTYMQKGLAHWYRHDGNWYCNNCNNNLFANPKYHPRQLCFKNKRVLLKYNPRVGICFSCGKNGGRTNMHHIEYHDEDPLKDTIELCGTCHNKTKLHPRTRHNSSRYK